MASHSEFLREASRADANANSIADGVRTDYRRAPLSARERTMLDYAAKLTRTPSEMRESDVRDLRAVGFDDLGILHIVLLASWFNYITRVADGLGIELDGYIWEKFLQGEPVAWMNESASHPPVAR
ncbi:MAG TPA: hypothetical protein VHU81_03035 [Thermoanaerobaculia bacterium]|jgi:uncharacterized peroxidase-related enzyme|nr:hypothetical protein [Thermoanaerobaculia bacterium]